MNQTPIVDIFAGPGGLAEGFSSLQVRGKRPYRVVLSLEKNAEAHKTLLLRNFYRQFPDSPPADYWHHLRGKLTREDLFARYAVQHRRAAEEAVLHELGAATADESRHLVRRALKGHTGPWGLIGGPPCQAYSLIGRSRNRGNADYVAEKDHRQTLYVEYLQILADHRPTFFVMENVKGMLSAKLANEQIFERIRSDLEEPAVALCREGRRVGGRGPRYRVLSLSNPLPDFSRPEPADFIVRAEDYGIPQARHRVILLGVLEGVSTCELSQLNPQRRLKSLGSTLRGLPALRSGLTDQPDNDATWCSLISRVVRQPWMKDIAPGVRAVIRESVEALQPVRAQRGAEFVKAGRASAGRLGGFVNHSTRAHISADLERYFFASCFAWAEGRSPVLGDFPRALLPKHRNAVQAAQGSHFIDRFRVQLFDRPSTTITSHISKDGHYYVHPDPLQCRSLTVREAARLQTFPDDYLFCGSRTAQYQQVGNAVPPELARQVAELVTALV